MLFNLSQQTQFKNHRTGREIYCFSGFGPFYGNRELVAWNQPFNGDGKCISWANSATYKIPLKDGKNALTNKKNGRFTITELEVWQVTEVVTNYLLTNIEKMKKSEKKRETREDKRQTRQRVCYLLFYQSNTSVYL